MIGRFGSVDGLAEEMRSHSVYNYGLNNPMRYTDPDGNAPTDIIIRGAGNSSVTVKTELIDIKVNASSLGIDFGGNYTVQGDDILQASLDVVGIFDPTGIADGLNAGIAAKKGDWFSAAISTAGIIPFAGDLAKAGKIKKDINIIENAVDAVKTEEKIGIKIAESDKVDRGLLNSPSKHGNAPTFKSDGKSVEIHHKGQKGDGPFKEMHPDAHRGRGNDKVNHPDKGQKSEVDRKQFKKDREQYWKNEYPKG